MEEELETLTIDEEIELEEEIDGGDVDETCNENI